MSDQTEEARTAITEFLLARIAKDAAQARHGLHGETDRRPYLTCWCGRRNYHSGYAARVFADCKAKRAIVELIAATPGSIELGDDILAEMAAVYSDHPDYQPEWRL